eukprot:s4755_g1.t1
MEEAAGFLIDEHEGEEDVALPKGERDYLSHVETVESVVLLATSVHPAPYLASRECCRETHVLFDKPTSHSIEHGKAIASAMWAAEFLAKQPAANLGGNKHKALDDLQACSLKLVWT